MNNISNHTIQSHDSLKEALVKINEIPESLTLFVIDKNGKLIGSLTDGDIRRGLIKGLGMNSPLTDFMNKHFYFIQQGRYRAKDIEEIHKKQLRLVPLLDTKMRIKKLYNFKKIKSIIPVDAVLMAGGEGRRLRPMTDALPKPLLKVGGKPIIEYNIDRLLYFGIENIHITLRYLGKKIENHCQKKYQDIPLQFLYEENPGGTIASAGLIPEYKHDEILLMNSDILTNVNFEDMYKEFIEKKADFMVASVPYHIDLPYAILETDANSILSFKEKPQYTYYANSGIYIFKKELLELIPEETAFDATDLMEEVIKRGLSLIHYPIRSYWLDIGKKEDFEQAQLDIAHIDFS